MSSNSASHASADICLAEYRSEQDEYRLACLASVAFTMLAMVMYHCFLKERLQGAPMLGAQFFGIIGFFKLIFGTLIWIGFLPGCPAGCTCSGEETALPIYPIVAILIGLKWWKTAFDNYKMARQICSDSDDKDGPIFDQVPTVEMA